MSQHKRRDFFRVTSIPHSSAGWTIFSGTPLQWNSFKVSDGRYYVTIKTKPDLLPVAPEIGQQWVVEGVRIIEDTEVGGYVYKQHIFESPEHVECRLPDTGEQFIRFIAANKTFKGIGQSKARELWQYLGNQVYAILQNDSPTHREQLSQILTKGAIDALYQGYSKYKNLRHCNWMSEIKIPARIQQQLIKYHGENTVEAIKKNPYLLIGFGQEFSEVDKVAQTKFGVGLDNANRLSAALEFAISAEVKKGHTYTSQECLKPYLKKLLNDTELVSLALKSGHQKAQFLLNETSGVYHPTAPLLMESVVAKRLLKLSKQRALFNEQANRAFEQSASDLPYELTDKQTEAIIVTLNNAVSCITGGAGTGKTTVLRTALKAHKKLGFEIHAVALSGRAAMRLHESIGFFTSTIAGFLRREPIVPAATKPQLLVIDEASMVDLPTMYRLVNHLHPAVHMIFTGDPDQLPPIGCGKVLADIVDSCVIANTKLDIVKRQKGNTGIPEYSEQVNQGEIPLHLSSGNIYFHNVERQSIEQTCSDLYKQSPENSQVIGATINLVREVNKKIQAQTNSVGEPMTFQMHGEEYHRGDIKKGDAIIFTQNNYDKGIQNGTLGTLTSISSGNGIFGTVTLDTGEKIDLNHELIDNMELGYGITLHKAQGSQFPRVIVAFSKGRIVDRAWLYTAITRAEYELHIVGSESDFREIVLAKSYASKRKSYLLELIKSEISGE